MLLTVVLDVLSVIVSQILNVSVLQLVHTHRIVEVLDLLLLLLQLIQLPLDYRETHISN